MSARSRRRTSILLILLAVLVLTAGAAISAQPAVGQADVHAATDDSDASFRSSPVMFIENAGQWPEGARFQVWGGTTGTMWLAEDAIWVTVIERSPVPDLQVDGLRDRDPSTFHLQPSDLPPARAVNIKLSFVGANPHPRIQPFDRLDTVVSYFIRGDPDQWQPDVPVWGGVRYVDLYPGMNLEVTSQDGQVVQRLDARPGADLSTVRLRVEGADAVAVEGGGLRLSTAAAEFTLLLQRADGLRVAGSKVESSDAQTFDVVAPFVSAPANRISTIDTPLSPADNPADLLYGTFLGGSGDEEGFDVVVDGSGSIYVTGETNSTDFPSVPGAFDRSLGGSYDAFVVKMNSSGSGLVYASFLGGSASDGGRAISVDASGSAHATGRTNSSDFPTTSGSFDVSQGGGYCHYWTCYDLFVVKLAPSGSSLVFSTFLGGNQDETNGDIAVDDRGLVYVTGSTASPDFPTTGNALDSEYAAELCFTYTYGCPDAFVSKFSANGKLLLYSTYLGGYGLSSSAEDGKDFGKAIAVDGTEKVVIVGGTSSTDFPTTAGALDRSRTGYSDGFVAKVDTVGGALVFSTLLGGSASETANAIVLRPNGSILVAMDTASSDFPTTGGAFDRSHNGDSDVAVVQLNSTGSSLLFSTLLGGSSGDVPRAMAVDSAGAISLVGVTRSAGFPITANALSRTYNGGNSLIGDGFAARLKADGGGLLYSTFLLGSSGEQTPAIAVGGDGRAYITSSTSSSAFPTTAGAFDRSYNGSRDTFVIKLAMGGAVVPPTPTPVPTYIITGRVTDAGSTGIPGVTVWAGSSSSTTTDATGSYTFAGLPAGTYNISPSRYLYAFSPALRTVTVPPNATGQDFVQTPVVDLSVNRIEVAQVFADATTNPSGASVPLIAEKDSLVRVFVKVTGISALGGVTARLHIRDAQGVLHTLDETYPPYAIWARQNPDRRLLQDTVNFRPPPEWLRGTIGLWADVDPGNIIPETDEGNNTNSTAFTATFEDGKQWRIAWTALGYFDGQSLHLPDRQVAGTGDQRLRTLYPVGKSDVDYFFQPGYTEILGVPFDTHSAEYIKAANRFWKRVAADYGWVEGRSPDRLYGWISGSARQPDTICGISDPDWPDYGGLGRVAVGADHCDKVIDGNLATMPGANVFAHEIGHILSSTSLRHPLHAADSRYCFGSLGDPKSVYPIYKDPSGTAYPLGSIGAYGLDVARNWVLSPNTNYDFMAYCWPTWISPYHYVRLHDEFVENPSSAAGVQAGVAVTNQLLVSGLVYTPTLQTTLDPFYAFRSASTPDVDTGTAFCLELRDAGQGLLSKRCFDLVFHDIETDESSDIDSFALAVPYPAGTTQIVLTHLGTPIATRAVSLHAPTVRLLSPNGGETWAGSGTHTVTWTASDLDGDTLHFALSCSIDGGASWVPAGLDLTGTQHALDVSMLPGGTSVLLRISATDGVNTTDDVSDASFTVGRKAPMAFILSPEEDAHFFPGAAIWLEGRAFDLEDGTLGDAALRWSSDRDGVLGTGKLLIATLSPGQQTITLTATDSDGARATATIRLSAGDRVFLPVVLR